jgi:hypothetical protein
MKRTLLRIIAIALALAIVQRAGALPPLRAEEDQSQRRV